MDVERMRAAIGPRADYYLARFERIERGGAWFPSWNFPAFFFSTAWFEYRRMHGWAKAYVALLFGGMMAALLAQSLLVVCACLVVAFVIVPAYANTIYFRSLTSRLARADAAKSAAKASKLRRPPSAWTIVTAVLANVLLLLMAALIVVAIPAYSDYVPRTRIAEGIAFARSTSEQVAAFHAAQRRLPSPQEAPEFRIKQSMKHVESVAYDSDRRMIVVTMRGGYNEGRRFALHATEKDGALAWTCRSIDVERRFLPADCRE